MRPSLSLHSARRGEHQPKLGAEAERLFRRIPTERSEVGLNAVIDEVRQNRARGSRVH